MNDNREENQQQQGEREANEKRVREENKHKEHMMVLNTVVMSVQSLFHRQRVVKDPATRAIMFVDKLLMLLDVAMPLLNSLSYKYRVEEDIQQRIKTTSDQIRKEIDFLMLWIQHPHLSPDHPLGRHVMAASKQDFEEQTTKAALR